LGFASTARKLTVLPMTVSEREWRLEGEGENKRGKGLKGQVGMEEQGR